MQSLLRWSVENSEPGAQPAAPRKDLDPGIIDHILGKPDAELMKEALSVATDASNPDDVRVGALDDFEMLIEQIDNASNIEKLNMWHSLHDLLTSPSSPDSVRRQTLWVIGTAVQNNPAAQQAYLALDPFPTLLSFFAPSVPAATRAKAVYALSGLLKHSAAAVRQLNSADGWDTLRNALEDSDIGVRRKAAFLLNTLLVPTGPPAQPAHAPTGAALHTTPPPGAPVHPNTHAALIADPSAADTSAEARAALRTHGLARALVGALVRPVPFGPDGEHEHDADFVEKVIGALSTYVNACGEELDEQEKKDLRAYFEREGTDAEKWGISQNELQTFLAALA